LSNLLNVAANHNSSNIRGTINQDLSRYSSKKKLSKNKSPSFISLSKKEDGFSKKSFKSHLYVPTKLYSIKTELTEANTLSFSNNKLVKKKKLVTESNEIFRDLSNDFMKNAKTSAKKDG